MITTANARHTANPLPEVLIVNDTALARAVTAAMARASGAFTLAGEVTCSNDGVALARQLRPDLVLLDMHMQDINGVDVTRRLMAERPTRILVTSTTIRRNTTYPLPPIRSTRSSRARSTTVTPRHRQPALARRWTTCNCSTPAPKC
jgi:CheY-like chemotaxis protein